MSGIMSVALQVCPLKLSVSEDSEFLDSIHMILLDKPWKGKIKAAAKSHASYRQAYAKERLWQKRLDATMRSFEVPIHEDVPEQAMPKWECDVCQFTCGSKRALAMHSQKSSRVSAIDQILCDWRGVPSLSQGVPCEAQTSDSPQHKSYVLADADSMLSSIC